MAFNGSLLSLSGAEFPWQYIQAESYQGSLKSMDLDSTRVSTGVLNRNVLDHQAIEISFQTLPLNNTETADLWAFIRNHYISKPQERKCRVTAYIPELDDYVTQDAYVASDPTFSIRRIDPANRVIEYDSYEIKFIGY